MMTMKIGINGLGRIGRNILRLSLTEEDVEVVLVNDITDVDMLAHLLKYDSVHGKLPLDVHVEEDHLIIDGRTVHVSTAEDPSDIPWGEHDVDLVIESTGRFNTREDAEKHVAGGAKRVILSAPGGDVDAIVMGVNEEIYDPDVHTIISNASCTTNCIAPLAKVLDESFGIERGLMTTIHSYTNDQRLLDQPHKDYRRARAAAENMIPTSTGAAKMVGKIIPTLDGKLNGMAVRVPTPDGSLVDFVADVRQKVTAEEVNAVFKEQASGPLASIIDYTDAPIVSRDIIGNTHSTIVDGLSTMVIDETMVKVIAWYDNEIGYSARCLDLARYMKKIGI